MAPWFCRQIEEHIQALFLLLWSSSAAISVQCCRQFFHFLDLCMSADWNLFLFFLITDCITFSSVVMEISTLHTDFLNCELKAEIEGCDQYFSAQYKFSLVPGDVHIYINVTWLFMSSAQLYIVVLVFHLMLIKQWIERKPIRRINASTAWTHISTIWTT